MSKKKDGKGKAPTTKNINMIGGENTLPKKDGKVDYKKIVNDGKKEKQKPWTERIGIKKVSPSSETKSTPAVTSKGTSRLKAALNRSTPKSNNPTKTVTTPKKAITTKGISKFKAASPKAKAVKAKAPVKKPPTKGR